MLSRATWKVGRGDVKGLVAPKSDAARFRAVQNWRRRLRLPRWIVLVDADNELPVDVDKVLSVEAFLALIKPRDRLKLCELFPAPDGLCADGPEGRFVHGLVVPYERRREKRRAEETPEERRANARRERRRPAGASSGPAIRRTFTPGSEWLYAKLYTGIATADPVLCGLGALCREALAAGAADHWFFLRYADPHWHLRLRLQGEPSRLYGEVLPRLHRLADAWLADGLIWRLDLATSGASTSPPTSARSSVTAAPKASSWRSTSPMPTARRWWRSSRA